MEEINVVELLNYYLKKLPIIIIVTIIMMLIGLIYTTNIKEPLYQGTTTIILVQKQTGNESSAMTQSELTINEKLVTTYSQIIKSRRVLETVISSLELNTTPDKLAKNITVTAVSETSIIKVTVSDKDNEQAATIANEVASIFKQEISKIYNLENISVVDNAIVEDKPYNINILKETIIFGLIGLIATCGIIFIIYYFDNSIKNKKEVEEKLHLAVLGEIPVATKLEKKTKGVEENERTNSKKLS